MRRVGIDLALKAPHRAAVFDGAQAIGKSFAVQRTKGGVDELVRRATAGTSDDVCEFIMEPTGLAWLPLAAELARRGHQTYVPKPQKTHALRVFLSQFAKTDGVDAKAQALVRHVDPTGVHALHVPSAAETTLRLCAKQRARLVVDAARAKGRIQSWLVLANPHVGEAIDLFTDVGVAFLRRHLDPFRVRAMGRAELKRFWQRQVRGQVDEDQLAAVWTACETTCEFYEAQRAAGTLPFDYAVVQAMVVQELERIELLESQVAALEDTLQRAYRLVDPERVLEREVPGVAATIGATIEGFVGDVERFESAKRFAGFFGLVPRTRQTGGKDGAPRQRLTKGGQALLKKYMYLAAETARRCDPELAVMYATCIARGKHHYASVIAVAHKLVRKIYAMLKLRAAARRAVLEGRPAPEVAYRYLRPDTGEIIGAKEARAYVNEHFPSKAAKERAKGEKKKRAAEAAPRKEGSSKDVTNVDLGTPPIAFVTNVDACGKSVDNAVINPLIQQAKFSVDGT